MAFSSPSGVDKDNDLSCCGAVDALFGPDTVFDGLLKKSPPVRHGAGPARVSPRRH